MKWILAGGLLVLASCGPQDWRAEQTRAAEDKIRADVGSPGAKFVQVQVTGDNRTGQICGLVELANGQRERFVVYIDGTAGPYVENGAGREYVSAETFEAAWTNDCLNEGYQPQSDAPG